MIKAKHGTVVNISTLIPVTVNGKVTYQESGHYLRAFTKALNQQLVGTGVRTQILYPGYGIEINQDYRSATDSDLRILESVVDRSTRDISLNNVISVPSLLYRLLLYSIPILPESMTNIIRKWLLPQPRKSSEFSGFQKRTWSGVDAFIRDVSVVLKNRNNLPKAIQNLDRDLLHRLMLIVSRVNGCRYCTNFHASAALADGMTPEEVDYLLEGIIDSVPEKEMPTLLYALYWAEEGGHTDEGVRQDILDRYGESYTQSVESALQIIKVANYAGNAFDFIIYTLSGGRFGNETR
jgi:AhpD family alkylhydroperoxidase